MTRRLRIEDLTAFAIPEQPTVSPDGTRCAYVLATCDVAADRNVHAIWRVGTRAGEPHQLTRGAHDVAPAWSPDGTRIAFLRTGDDLAQLWSLPVAGGEPEQLTTLPLGAGEPVWSPDGSRIAFTAATDPVHGAPDDQKPGPPAETERLDYQLDGVGLFAARRSHLFVLDVAGGECRQVTEGDWHAGKPAWSPDGTKLAFSAAIAPDSDLTWIASAWVVDVSGPVVAPELVALPDGQAGGVRWAADGALLVVGLPTTKPANARLFRVPPEGGEPVDLLGSLDRSVVAGLDGFSGGFQALADGRVLICVADRGCSHLYVATPGSEPAPVVTGASRNVASLGAAGSTVALVLATGTSAGEIVVVDLDSGVETVRTEHGANLADVEWFEGEDREFTVSDGTVVHGWLFRDPDVTGPAPLLLDIHGGPHAAWNDVANGIDMHRQELVSRGWSVLILNPRGSDGYGEAFVQAALGAWGEADAKDLLEPIDQLVADGIADADRLAVTGYSYGSYLTCFLTSRDTRFRAAVTGGVVSHLTSMYGTSDAGQYLGSLEALGAPWSDAERYAAMSPFSRIDHVTTPTLIMQGTSDMRTPMGQAQEWHAALRARGVPSKLVLFPGGSHEFIVNGPPSHRLEFNRRTVEWLVRWTVGRRAPIDAGHWQRRLEVLVDRHKIPSATLGILRIEDDTLVEAAAGVLNVDTGVRATTDSLFQIGSITKVWTTTIVQQLVDEGRLNLDAPVVDVLPELKLTDVDAAARVTMRHLLTHTSGIDGDVFTDAGRGDDCVARYVEQLAEVAQNHPLGATWSYCNAGFILAGRVIEKLTGDTWDKAVQDRIIKPLGLTHTTALPEEALLYRAAVGHLTDGTRAPVWMLPRAVGPAGLLTSTAADLLAFARLHLTGGVGPDGTRVLSQSAADAMAAHQADLPMPHPLAESWGLGWMRANWDGHQVIGHDGNTIGQSAYLRLLPAQGLAVVLLTNTDAARDLSDDLYREIFAEVADVNMPRPMVPPAEKVNVDVTPHVGTYERASVRMEVLMGENGPVLRETATGPFAELSPEQEFPLVAVDENLYLAKDPDQEAWRPVKFYGLPTGERYLHFSSRATPKTR
ncbi:MAG TPA: serine hydrolase [Pseudonocardiaceae bacterium]|jgi:dipeptidyl aminopeptidase/acylaminoacyl peptidase|nr:serine hydrolase [Pseudonocardiaceae bacterium]